MPGAAGGPGTACGARREPSDAERRMLGPMQRWSFALATLALACDVKELPPPIRHAASAPCRSASDCSSGSCQVELGICNTPSGALQTLLFEIVPPATDPRYDGAHFYSYQTGLASSSSEPLVLRVPERVTVQGQVDAAPEQEQCSREGNSLPVSLTFTPREHLWGLSVPSFSFDATRDRFDDTVTDEFRFSGSLPPGRYDVYMRARPGYSLPPSCNLAPQIFRDIAVGLDTAEAGPAAAPLTPVQRSLKLSMDWRDELDGWNVDMVHPVTGEIISTRSTLQRSRVVDEGEGPVIEFTLHFSLGGEKDFIREGEELVRLTPPPLQESKKGIVLLQREGLELVTPGEGKIGDVTTFGEPVNFQSWISDDDLAIDGTVSFAATSLTGTVGGVDASFTGTVAIDPLGQITVPLLPGNYRMRVTPSPGAGLAANEYPVTVQPGAPTQGGGVIPLPRAARVDGIALSPSGVPLRGVEVVLNASKQPLEGCAAETSAADPLCDHPRAEVLQRALGEDPFMPRSRSGLTAETGAFGGIEADCGGCARFGPGAGFDITLRPPPENGLPWMVKPALRVATDTDLEEVQFPLPVTRPLRVVYRTGSREELMPGALVTAYVLLDAESRPIDDPLDVPPCLGAKVEDPVCIQSALPIAEGRSDPDGVLWLLLPPSLE